MKNKLIIAAAVIATGTTSAFIYSTILKGVDVKAIDKKVSPKKDFFLFSNGNWIKNNPIPASEGRWTAFNIVADRNNLILKTILETAAKSNNNDLNSSQGKVGLFYKVAMDTIKLNNEGFKPVQSLLNEIDLISNSTQILETVAKLHSIGISAAFSFSVSQDVKNSELYVPYLSQGGLGLPDKDYYLKNDSRNESIREDYVKLINEMFKMASQKNQQAGEMVLKFETGMAATNMSRTERRNMEKQYNPFSITDLNSKFNAISWKSYFETVKLNTEAVKHIIVMQPDYIAHLNSNINNNLDGWKAYLKWKIISTTIPYLHDKAIDRSFAFYGTKLTGTTEQKPRWKTTLAHANNMIGELVGQEFVKVAFTAESKKRVNEMVDNLSASFKDRINNLAWMSAPTKVKALEKLASFTRKLGYPDKWTDMTKLKLTDESYVANYFNSSNFWFNYNLNKLGKPVDKNEWRMLPQTVRLSKNSTAFVD